jgi:thioester reductase-like protein
MKVALTGATGYVGSHVLTELREHGHERLGDQFAEVLMLDQGTDAAKARAELGWSPSHPSLADEFRNGSYRK